MSGSQQGQPRGEDEQDTRHPTRGKDRRHRQSKSSELGRALRSVYDDTLREDIPNDLQDLLGKLS